MTYPTVGWQSRRSAHWRHSTAASVAQFAVAGLAAAALLTVITASLARRAGTEAASGSFERLAVVVAGSVLAPQLTRELRQGDPTAAARVRAAVQPLLVAGPVVGVSVLSSDGQVVWSDVPGAIGTRHPLSPDERRALADGSVVTESGTTQDPADLLTASVGVRDVDREALLVQVSERPVDVQQAVLTMWRQFAAVAVGAIVALELIHIPLAARLAHRVRGHQETEAALLDAAVTASDVERRRIAGDIHDTIVPGLTGLAYELDAARMAGSGGDGGGLLARTADGVRRSIAELRAMSAHLSRTPLPGPSLGPALAGLADRLEAGGIHVTVTAAGLENLPARTADVLFRCARETLRNVAAHSGAEQVTVTIDSGEGTVTMVIDDDGRGFDQARLSTSHDAGHLGLHALGGVVADAGGSLTVSSAPGQGTRVVVDVPLDPSAIVLRESR